MNENHFNDQEIKIILIDEIHILNPRVRNRQLFNSISENILKVGLKRPITVIKSTKAHDGKKYDLVCGQGRIETFVAAGRTEIPAIIIDSSQEDALIMSLVENLARRKHNNNELMKVTEFLLNQGDTAENIANKTGLTVDYIKDIIFLVQNGEERLLSAVEAGHIPVSIARKIVTTPDEEIQNALIDAYDQEKLKGKKFLMAKRLIEARKMSGRSLRKPYSRKSNLTGKDVLDNFNAEMNKYRMAIRRSEKSSNNLGLILESFRVLFKDDNFLNLLKAEKLETMPAKLLKLINQGRL